MNDRTSPTIPVPDPEEVAAAVARINALFEKMTRALVQLGESIAAAVESFDALGQQPGEPTAVVAPEAWAFQPGDVVDELQLHAARVDTVVVDADGAEWKRLRLRWIRVDDTGIVTSRDLANRGPITVVSVGGTSPEAVAASEHGSADPGFLLTFLMVVGLVAFGTGVVGVVDAVLG